MHLRVLLGGVSEEARADCLLDARGRLAAGDDVQLVAVHDAEQLLADVLRPLQRPHLHKVLVAPRRRELVVLPGVVHGEEGQVIL